MNRRQRRNNKKRNLSVDEQKKRERLRSVLAEFDRELDAIAESFAAAAADEDDEDREFYDATAAALADEEIDP